MRLIAPMIPRTPPETNQTVTTALKAISRAVARKDLLDGEVDRVKDGRVQTGLQRRRDVFRPDVLAADGAEEGQSEQRQREQRFQNLERQRARIGEQLMGGEALVQELYSSARALHDSRSRGHEERPYRKRPPVHWPSCSTRFQTGFRAPSATLVSAASSTTRRSRRRCARSASRCSRPTSTSKSSRISSPASASAPLARRC